MPKGLTMQDVTFGLEVTPYSDTSTGIARPLVLVGWRKGIFSLKHNLTHTGPRQNIMSGRKCPNNWHSGYKSAMSEKNPISRISSKIRMYQKVLTPNAQMTMTLRKDWTWYLVDSLWKTHQPSHRPSSMGLPTGELWEKFQKSIRTDPSYAPVYHHQASGIIEQQHKHWECPAMPTLGSWGWYTELLWVPMGLRNTFKPGSQDDMQVNNDNSQRPPRITNAGQPQPKGSKGTT